MKKCICFVLAVLLLLSLCACAQQDQPQIDAPPQTDSPTDPPTEPSTAPATEPPDEFATMPPTEPSEEPTELVTLSFEAPKGVAEAYALPTYDVFIYRGRKPANRPGLQDFDHSECKIGRLYYHRTGATTVYELTDEKVIAATFNSTHVFYVTKEEPTKIYARPVDKLKDKAVVFESDCEITALTYGHRQYRHTALLIVEDNTRLVWMNLLTGETRVLMEQEYILNIRVMDGSLAGGEKDGYRSIPDVQYICYNGKDSKEDAEFKQYYYNTETGKTLNTKEFWNETHQK